MSGKLIDLNATRAPIRVGGWTIPYVGVVSRDSIGKGVVSHPTWRAQVGGFRFKFERWEDGALVATVYAPKPCESCGLRWRAFTGAVGSREWLNRDLMPRIRAYLGGACGYCEEKHEPGDCAFDSKPLDPNTHCLECRHPLIAAATQDERDAEWVVEEPTQ